MPTPTKSKESHFSEVVSCKGNILIAQCYKENSNSDNDLKNGKLVKIIDSTKDGYKTFGLITKISNSSLDGIHKPSALGLNSDEIQELQPQVFELLRRELEIITFAYSEAENKIILNAPPRPMQIHDFVYMASESEIINLTSDLIPMLCALKQNQYGPEVLSETIKQAYLARNKDYNYLVSSGQSICSIFTDDLDTTMLMIKRIGTLAN